MSNQIETIEKLYAKTKTYKIPRVPINGEEQIDLEITPLSLEDMGSLNMKEDLPMAELAKNATIMFSKSLGIEEDKSAKISVRYMEELLSAVMEANNFKEDDIKKTGIKDFIKSKQEQIKKQQDGIKSD
jgi:hypothetical protein